MFFHIVKGVGGVCSITDSSFFGILAMPEIPDFLFYSFLPAIVVLLVVLVLFVARRRWYKGLSFWFVAIVLVDLIDIFLMWVIADQRYLLVTWYVDFILESVILLGAAYAPLVLLKNTGVVSRLKKFFSGTFISLGIILLLVTFSRFGIAGYDLGLCEAIYGSAYPLQVVGLIGVGLMNIIFYIFSVKKPPGSFVIFIGAPLVIGYLGVAHTLLGDWNSDLLLPLFLVVISVYVIFFTDEFSGVIKNHRDKYVVISVILLGFIIGAVSLVGFDVHRNVLLLSGFGILVLCGAMISHWLQKKIAEKRAAQLEAQQESLLETVQPESMTVMEIEDGRDGNRSERSSDEVYDKLSAIINNMMLAMPGGQYRKLEFTPHSVGQVLHTLQLIFREDVRFDVESVDDAKILVDIGFLAEFIESFTKHLSSESPRVITVSCQNRNLVLSWRQGAMVVMKESQRKMMHLMSFSLDQDSDTIIKVVIPLVNENNADTV